MNLKNSLVTIKSQLAAAKINAKGLKITGKLLIIESDDWGAIRTPSKEVLDAFKRDGIDVSKSIYKNDSLASSDDLALLFDILNNHKDIEGNSANITANAIMANPDFEKIKESDYQEYFYEPFTETLKKYPKHQNNLALWKQGMNAGVFQPQFHGREHVNINRWLKALQKNEGKIRELFDYNTTFSGVGDYSFMESYDWDNQNEIESHKSIISDGLQIFKNTFGFSSKTFIAPCYNWDSKLEPFLAEQGIQWMQGLRSQLQPTGTFDSYQTKKHSFGQQNNGLQYNIRNCFFEPSMLPSKNWVDSCLAQIQSAFLFSKPAVICSHRINFVGFINEKNRDRGLNDLDQLLKQVLKKWPDVKFISTDQLSKYIK
ncbi:polysaccharide (de)acetylase [Flavobacterium sp.]